VFNEHFKHSQVRFWNEVFQVFPSIIFLLGSGSCGCKDGNRKRELYIVWWITDVCRFDETTGYAAQVVTAHAWKDFEDARSAL